MSSQNNIAMEWLKLYLNSIKNIYEENWGDQPEEIFLKISDNLPTINFLKKQLYEQSK